MKIIMLGIGDFGSTKNSDESLKTMALGSCVACIIMDKATHMIGMVHIALPKSKINEDKAKETPGYFADTGIPALLNEMKKKGMKTTGEKLIVKLVGGAKIMDPNSTFNIGKRNIITTKKILWKYGMGVISEDTGGNISRTVTVDGEKGRVVISAPNKPDWKI